MIRLLQISGDIFLALVILASLAMVNFGRRWLVTDPKFGVLILVISGFMLIFVVFCLFLNKDRRLKVSLALFSASATLFAVNVILEFDSIRERVRSLDDLPQLAAAQGVDWDSRTNHQVVFDLRESGLQAYRAQYPSALTMGDASSSKTTDSPRLLPVGGISQSTVVLGNENGQYTIYRSDRYGFNNADRVYDNQNNGRRVLLVGDSMTHGCCVQEGQDVAGKLRSLGYNAISIGMSANGPLMELASLKEYGPHLAPDVVLWMYFSNDLNDLRKEYGDPTLRQYLTEGFSQDLVERQPEIDELWKKLLEPKIRTAPPEESSILAEVRANAESLYTLGQIRRLVGLDWMTYPVTNEHLDVFKTVLESAKEATASYGSELYFVYIPAYHSLARPFPFAPSRGRDKVLSIVAETGIPVVDFEPLLREQEDPLDFFPFRANGHYTPEGYELLTNLIVDEALKDR